MSSYYKFTGSNLQTVYGYGSAKEATAYVETLNAGKEINLYAADAMSVEEASSAKLDKRDDIVPLDEVAS